MKTAIELIDAAIHQLETVGFGFSNNKCLYRVGLSDKKEMGACALGASLDSWPFGFHPSFLGAREESCKESSSMALLWACYTSGIDIFDLKIVGVVHRLQEIHDYYVDYSGDDGKKDALKDYQVLRAEYAPND
jgi:hypothetical protein